MLVMVKHPENWEQKVKSHQYFAIKQFKDSKAERQMIRRDELARRSIEKWAMIRVVSGVIGLRIKENRVLALETGDCWLGYPGGLMEWYQEGAVELDTWSWQNAAPGLIPPIVLGFSDLLLQLVGHSTQVPPDPMPGFEFFKSGEVIIREGEAADSVYTLIQGKARVTVGSVLVGEAKENEIIGLQAMLLKTTRTATVTADGPCSAVKVTYDKFRSLIETRPELVISTLESMAQQIARANERMTQE